MPNPRPWPVPVGNGEWCEPYIVTAFRYCTTAQACEQDSITTFERRSASQGCQCAGHFFIRLLALTHEKKLYLTNRFPVLEVLGGRDVQRAMLNTIGCRGQLYVPACNSRLHEVTCSSRLDGCKPPVRWRPPNRFRL